MLVLLCISKCIVLSWLDPFKGKLRKKLFYINFCRFLFTIVFKKVLSNMTTRLIMNDKGSPSNEFNFLLINKFCSMQFTHGPWYCMIHVFYSMDVSGKARFYLFKNLYKQLEPVSCKKICVNTFVWFISVIFLWIA